MTKFEQYLKETTFKRNKKVEMEYITILSKLCLPGRRTILPELIRIGCPLVHLYPTDKAYLELIKSFQKHFRPNHATGKIDIETCAILYSLDSKESKSIVPF